MAEFCTLDGVTLIDDRGASSEPPPTVAASPTQPAATPHEQAIWNLPSGGFGGAQLSEPQPIAPAWQPPPPPSYVQPNKGLATASMILGIASFVCFGPIPAIVAIILGAAALSQMKKNPESVGGKQQAVTGIVAGSLTVLIYVGIFIFYIVLVAIAALNQ